MATAYAILILAIAVSAVVAAIYAAKALGYYGFGREAGFMMWGFGLSAFSWAFFSMGTQTFIAGEPAEVRTFFIMSGLVTKLVGTVLIATGFILLYKVMPKL